MLVNKFPGQAASLDKTYSDYLTKNGLSPNNAGVAVGEQAAARIIKAREKDGQFPTIVPGFQRRNRHRCVASDALQPSRRWLRRGWLTFDLSLFPTPHGFLAPTPPALTSDLYARDYNEVKAFGSLNNSARTPEQTDLAHFWNANYLAVWNEVLRNLASARLLRIGESRPAVRLSEHGNGRCRNYLMEFQTPLCLAAYHCYSERRQRRQLEDDRRSNVAAIDRDPTLSRLHFGSEQRHWRRDPDASPLFRQKRNDLPGDYHQYDGGSKTRIYHHFTDAADEVVQARVYEGIHFLFAGLKGGVRARVSPTGPSNIT